MKQLALALLLSPIALFAADEALPKADTLLDHYVDVIGGKAALEKHHNEVMHASMEIVGMGVKGAMTVYHAAPDKERVTLDLQGIGKIDGGSNGEVAWENSALQGPRIKDGIEKADAMREATFNGPIYWRKLYVKAETTGTETVEGHDCYKVVLTPKEGKPVTHYFDKKSGLMIKTARTQVSPMGEIAAEGFADDYRKEGGILVPHKLMNKIAGRTIQIDVQSLEFDADLPKDAFDLPEEVQALLKKAAPAPAAAAKPATASVSAASASADKGKLTVYMGANPIATENYTVRKADGKIEVNGSGNAAMGPMKIDIEQFKVVTDEKYQLLEAAAKAKLGQVQMNVKTTFADGKAKSEVDTGQGPQTKEDDVHPDAIVVNAQLPLYPWSFLLMRADFKTKEPQQFPVYVIGQAEVTATVVFKGREPVEFAGKTVELNHLKADGATPQGQKVSLDFWVDDNRKLIKLAVPSQGVEAYQEGFERKAPPPKPAQ